MSLARKHSPKPASVSLRLEPEDNRRLANLCGQFDDHIREIEKQLQVEINRRGNDFRLVGQRQAIRAASRVLEKMYREASHEDIEPSQVHLMLREASNGQGNPVTDAADAAVDGSEVRLRRGAMRARSENQQGYLQNIAQHDITFGVGPAGTGKTWLAVACAVQALEQEQVRRLILARPAVEAGENLGFLPGDMAQKIDPYLRPLYDALYEMLGFEQVHKLMERHVIEVAPLAFMRGRTLNEAFIILDEAQNTTIEQMKMFLTRIGFGARVVVTGDTSQVDLPRSKASGLRHALEVLKDEEGIGVTHFTDKDVVRHPLVQKVVNAYARYEQQEGDNNGRD